MLYLMTPYLYISSYLFQLHHIGSFVGHTGSIYHGNQQPFINKDFPLPALNAGF